MVGVLCLPSISRSLPAARAPNALLGTPEGPSQWAAGLRAYGCWQECGVVALPCTAVPISARGGLAKQANTLINHYVRSCPDSAGAAGGCAGP